MPEVKMYWVLVSFWCIILLDLDLICVICHRALSRDLRSVGLLTEPSDAVFLRLSGRS